jgi:hypothetical protein
MIHLREYYCEAHSASMKVKKAAPEEAAFSFLCKIL